MRKLSFGVIAVLILVGTALTGKARWTAAQIIGVGPENQTQFFKGYNPEPVYKKFQYDAEFHGGEGKGAGAGVRSIQYHADFSPRFIMQTDRKQEFLTALREDILLRFRSTGTKVVASHDEADGGFTYEYAAGNNSGWISVHAPVHDSLIHRQYELAAGLDDIAIDIVLQETWRQPANESRWWMAAVN